MWPSGGSQYLGQILVDDDWVSKTFSQSLSSGFESGLGEWVGAGGRLPSGEMIEVVKYKEQESIGFQLRIDREALADTVLSEFIRVSGISVSLLRLVPPFPL
jgi:hypothetical protein